MKKVLFVLALVMVYGLSVSTANGVADEKEKAKVTVVADDNKTAKAEDAPKATAAKAEGCGEAKAEAKADGCSGVKTAAKGEGCSGEKTAAKAEGCSGTKTAAKAEGCSDTKTAAKAEGCSGSSKTSTASNN
ncbi:MAG: hypothetical protein K0B11_21150 [Mariniphaga sp.]|nr:hypothetical protein [Mariniphaga sp.]